MEKMINRPIAGTFGWLHMGAQAVEVPDQRDELQYRLAAGEVRTVLVEDDGTDRAITADLPEGACLHLVQISVDSGADLQVTDLQVHCAEKAAFHWYRLVLGGQNTYDNCSVTLAGDDSNFTADIGYQLADEDCYDINCEAIHLGKCTESAIRASGVLADEATKLMRGTIDFRTDCSGSVGNESEDVLLMDETAHNQSVPVILCAEEDVVGNHGATIGRPSEEVLYYMESRGIGEKEALRMLSRAKILSVAGKIPDAKLRECILQSIGEVQGDNE